MGGKSPLPGRRPPSRSHLEGPAPLAPSPINRGVRGGLHTQAKAQPLPSPTPLLLRTCLAKPCVGGTSSSSPHRRADETLPQHSAGSEFEGHHRAERVQELRGVVLSVLDRSGHEEVRLHQPRCHNASARDLQVVCRCKLTPLTRCLDELIDGSW